MESLDANDVYRYIKGRTISDEAGGAVPDVILVGLHSLTEGKKTPLTDYNDAFFKLQRRRRITSVAEQAQRYKSSLNQPQPPTSSIHPQNTEPTISNVEDSTKNEDESMGDDDDQQSDKERDQPTELEQILEDISKGVQDPTLPRANKEDVALDMDEVEEVVEEPEEEESGEESAEE